MGFEEVARRWNAAGRTLKFRLKTIDKGEKLFERFSWLGALAAFWHVSGINQVPVRPSCLHLVRQFYPAEFIVDMQTLLLCLLSCQGGEEVA